MPSPEVDDAWHNLLNGKLQKGKAPWIRYLADILMKDLTLVSMTRMRTLVVRHFSGRDPENTLQGSKYSTLCTVL